MPLSPDQISILLTAAIDVKGIGQMQRADTQTRLADYCQALGQWLADPWVRNIIFVENSGYPLDALRELARRHPSKQVEFLSFDGQDFPRHLGKGYGETLALQHVLAHSSQLVTTGRFLKVNGRYYVPNLTVVLRNMAPEVQVFCNITKSLSYSDSRVFGGSLLFLSYVCKEGLCVNDSEGFWFEHALSKAALKAIADGLPWSFMSRLPIVDGVSGTLNNAYQETALHRRLKGMAHGLKQKLLSL